MVINVNGPGSVKAADRTKAKSKATATGGPSFADMLEDAQSAAETGGVAAAPATGLSAGYVPVEEDLPQNPRQQAQELLKTLRTLAEDAFAGSPTATAQRLQQLAAELDTEGLTTTQKEALEEARTRAAVEVAKLKG